MGLWMTMTAVAPLRVDGAPVVTASALLDVALLLKTITIEDTADELHRETMARLLRGDMTSRMIHEDRLRLRLGAIQSHTRALGTRTPDLGVHLVAMVMVAGTVMTTVDTSMDLQVFRTEHGLTSQTRQDTPGRKTSELPPASRWLFLVWQFFATSTSRGSRSPFVSAYRDWQHQSLYCGNHLEPRIGPTP